MRQLRAPMLLIFFSMAACQQTSSPPVAVSAPQVASSAIPYVTPKGFHLPEGTGCRGEIARFQAVMNNDLETGHVNDAVYKRIMADLSPADVSCNAGQEGTALGQLRSTQVKFGYKAKGRAE